MSVYFERYAYPERLFAKEPHPDVKVIVVIPCFNEPDIVTTLESLKACQPVNKAEVIIIVNESVDAEAIIKENNRQTLLAIEEWEKSAKPWFTLLRYHLLMPAKDAGVGFARKAGMDEAARRFADIDRQNGLIACFDADSTCMPNYFSSLLEEYFQADKSPVGSAIYFEHPFPEDYGQRNGIIQYELHLRYYVHALRRINYPYSFQTVGSSMVVRSDFYQKIGGMNKRKAGEDFYFLHRLIPSGLFTEIKSTTIYPSPRISHRVPFGTGKAMAKWQEQNLAIYETYSLKSFEELGRLFERTSSLYGSKVEQNLDGLPSAIHEYLKRDNFSQVLKRLNRQSNSIKQFRKNFYAYFDGFKVLKYLHYSRDNHHPNKPVVEEAIQLAAIIWPEVKLNGKNSEAILAFYRQIDRSL